jgi:hypothetical protein
MNLVWSPPQVEKRVDSNPSLPTGARTGVWWLRRRGGGADIPREGSFGSQDNTCPGRKLGKGLILNFAGRVSAEGRRAGWRKKGWEIVSRELLSRVPGAGRNGIKHSDRKYPEPKGNGLR